MKKITFLVLSFCVLILLSACGTVLIDPGTGTESGAQSPVAPEISSDGTQELPVGVNLSGDLIPDGVLVSTGSENSLTFLDTNGSVVQEIETPGIISVDPDDVAICGPIVPDGAFPPLVYHNWSPEQALMVNSNGDITTSRTSDMFLSMVAAPGQAALAFSEVGLNVDNNPHSFLYAAKVTDLGNANALYDLVDEPYYWAIKPVGIHTVGGEAQGIWYTKTAWGIGGVDLIFPIDRGLYFFDLTSGNNTQYLDDEHSFQGISPDLAMAAHVPSADGSQSGLSVFDLDSGQTTQFPLDPATDRGAGYAVISPDNRFAAWLEATGSLISDPYDFHPRVQIGEIQTGGIVQSVADGAVMQILSLDNVNMLRPAGWLDNETLLIEVRGPNWDDVNLLSLNITSGELANFASGSFLEFGYQ